jgi:hypothetical protein
MVVIFTVLVSIVALAAINFLSFIFYLRMEAELDSVSLKQQLFSILYFHQNICTYTLSAAAAAALVNATTYMFHRTCLNKH